MQAIARDHVRAPPMTPQDAIAALHAISPLLVDETDLGDCRTRKDDGSPLSPIPGLCFVCEVCCRDLTLKTYTCACDCTELAGPVMTCWRPTCRDQKWPGDPKCRSCKHTRAFRRTTWAEQLDPKLQRLLASPPPLLTNAAAYDTGTHAILQALSTRDLMAQQLVIPPQVGYDMLRRMFGMFLNQGAGDNVCRQAPVRCFSGRFPPPEVRVPLGEFMAYLDPSQTVDNPAPQPQIPLQLHDHPNPKAYPELAAISGGNLTMHHVSPELFREFLNALPSGRYLIFGLGNSIRNLPKKRPMVYLSYAGTQFSCTALHVDGGTSNRIVCV